MDKRLEQIRHNIDKRSMRERMLIFLCLLALVFMFWTLIVQASIDNQGRDLRSQSQALNAKREDLNVQIAQATRRLSTDPNREQKNRIQQLEQAINDADQQLVSSFQGLVLASELPGILQQVLAETRRVRLIKVQTLPVRELTLGSSSTGARGVGVYEHTVLLQVSGTYFQLVDFLRALESASARFYWEQLDYRVTAYPTAEIDIRVYTLSTEKGPIGVW